MLEMDSGDSSHAPPEPSSPSLYSTVLPAAPTPSAASPIAPLLSAQPLSNSVPGVSGGGLTHPGPLAWTGPVGTASGALNASPLRQHAHPLDGCSAVARLRGGGASGRPAALHALRLELSTRRPSGGEASGRPAVLHALRLELPMRRPSGGEAIGRPAALHALRLELSMRRASGGEAIGRPSRTDVDHHAVVTRARRVALRQRRRRLLVIHLGTSSRSQ